MQLSIFIVLFFVLIIGHLGIFGLSKNIISINMWSLNWATRTTSLQHIDTSKIDLVHYKPQVECEKLSPLQAKGQAKGQAKLD